MKVILVIILGSACAIAQAAPPPGYNLSFKGNFKGKGGQGDGWLPILEWGPLPNPYILGNEMWYPEFIDHTPDGRDFGYAAYTPATASQGYGRMTWTPYQSSGQWYGGFLCTVDNQIHGYSVSPPFTQRRSCRCRPDAMCGRPFG